MHFHTGPLKRLLTFLSFYAVNLRAEQNMFFKFIIRKAPEHIEGNTL